MKTIGMIGGMSWESTQHYYQIMNQYVHTRLGGHHSIESIIYSVNFERVLRLCRQEEWGAVAEIVADLAGKLETAGADFLIMTANTIHKIFSEVERAISIPIIHIVDPTGEAIQKSRIRKVGLLGTKTTMEEDFYKDRLTDRYHLEVVVPEKNERELLQKIIFDELVLGQMREDSRKKLIEMIKGLSEKGATGVILGCTELTLLIGQKDTKMQLFDTTDLHAKAAVDIALSG